MVLTHWNVIFVILEHSAFQKYRLQHMLGLSVIIRFNLIFNVNSNLAESSANCSEILSSLSDPDANLITNRYRAALVSRLGQLCVGKDYVKKERC